MEDIIDIIVTETTNLIEITSQPTDEVIDVNIIDNREDITLNVTPSVVEININSLTGNFGVEWGDIIGTLSNQTDLNTALSLKADLVDGKVPSSQLPSYVDDVVEVANYASLPATGEVGKIYITLDTNFIYRWTGSTYVEIKDSSAVWGAITGTLSSQTDLQNALNLKANDNAVVHNTGNETIAGQKTFTGEVISTIQLTSPTIKVQNSGNASLYSLLLTNSSGIRNVYLPDADGTIALTSNLHNPVTLGTANGLSLSTQVLSLGLASSSANGALSSTDWTTFNNKLSTATAAATYVPYTGATGAVDLGANNLTSKNLIINGAASTFRQLSFYTSSSPRWSIYASNLAETGSNAGSDLVITKTNDDGVTTSPVFTISRATGNTQINFNLSVSTLNTAGIVTNTSAGLLGTSAGTGFLKMSSGTISYDNSTYLTTSSAASTYLALSGGTMTGNLLLPANNTVGGTNYYIGQTMGGSDNWKIFGNTVGTDQGELVFSIGDNGVPIASNGQRFRFYYDASSDGTSKDALIIDYNTSTFTTSIVAKSATLNRATSGDANGLILQTNGTSNWYLGSSAIGANTDYQIYNHSASAVVFNLANTSGAATFLGDITIGTIGNSSSAYHRGSFNGTNTSANLSAVYFSGGDGTQNRAGLKVYQTWGGTYTDTCVDLFVTKGGVGGTTALSINGAGTSTFLSTSYNITNFNSTYGQANINIQNNGTTFAVFGSGASSTSSAGANDVGIGTAGLNNAIVFATGSGYTERLRITSAGHIQTNGNPVYAYSGSVSIGGSYQTIFASVSGGVYLVSVTTDSADGTFGLLTVINDPDKSLGMIYGNNISLQFSGDNVQMKSTNGSTYNTTWTATRLK